MMVVFVDSSTNMNDERVFLVDQTLHEISDNFPLSLTQVNNSGSCVTFSIYVMIINVCVST
jgi:hypothetical protein